MKQPEFQDVIRLEGLLTALEQQNALFQVLRRSLAGIDVTIHIGAENPYEPMHECALITRPYSIGDKRVGYLGIVGPTRMHYQRAISAVNFMSASLSRMLTSMCVD
jgi:heat-inducible transcriptional repressor